MRVVPFATRLDIGGTEKQLVNLVTGMHRDHFDVRCAVLRRHGKLLEALEQDGLPVSEFPIDKLYGPATWRQQLRFAAWTRKEQIDVVHSLGMYANVFALPAAWLARRPALIGSVREQTSFWRPAHGRLNLLALRLADRVVTNACTVRDDLIARGLPGEKIRVIPNGIEVDRFARPRGDAGLRAELGLAADSPIVAVLSRLAAGKGVEDFLDAAALVAAERPDTRFLVVGDGADIRGGVVLPGAFRGAMRQRAIDLGLGDRVTFVGHRLDVPEILAQIDVSVLPSRSEALSNALLESMASGAPVVATAVGDHGLVVGDGESGLLCPSGDPAALARATLRLLADRELAARLGEGARRLVRARFSVERMVRATEDLYAEVAEARGAGRGLLRGHESTRRPSPACDRVEIVRDATGLAALAEPWQRLVERAGPEHPFVTHEWMTAWWSAFGDGKELHVVVAYRDEECVGIAPLRRTPARMYGVPVTRLELCANLHTPRADFLATDAAALEALIGGICQSRWDVLVLPQLEASSPTLAALARVAGERGIRTHEWRAPASPVLRLADAGDQPTFLAAVSRSLRAGVRRSMRRLARVGAVRTEIITGGEGGEAVERALAEGFAIEAAAWKGAHGTAITSDPAVRRFYESLAAAAATRGWLELRFLTVTQDGIDRRIAFNLALRYRGTLYLIKHGYDPRWAQHSPAILLCHQIIAEAREAGLGAVDFLGSDEDWKMRWTHERRPHVSWLYAFAAGARARLVEAIKFGVVPLARDGVRAWFAAPPTPAGAEG